MNFSVEIISIAIMIDCHIFQYFCHIFVYILVIYPSSFTAGIDYGFSIIRKLALIYSYRDDFNSEIRNKMALIS